jgi:cell division protein FtsQ
MTQQQSKRYSLVAFLLIIPIIVLGFIAANFFNTTNTCRDIKINILNDHEASFITKEDVALIVKNNAAVVNGVTKTKDINIRRLEETIQANPWVSNANLFFDNKNSLNIEVEQRIPVLRWLNGDISQNYLDETAMVIPVTNNFGANVPIVTSQTLPVNLNTTNLKLQLIGLAKYIKQDTFWNVAITQINVNASNKIELYTSIADQKIIFGDTTLTADKLARLLKFYQTVAPRKGWDAYSTIDLSYHGQVVAQKSGEETVMAFAQQIPVIKPVIKKASPSVILKPTIRKPQNSTANSPKPAVKKIEVIKPKPKTNIVPPKNTAVKTTIPKVTSEKVQPKKVVVPTKKPITKKANQSKQTNTKPATK